MRDGWPPCGPRASSSSTSRSVTRASSARSTRASSLREVQVGPYAGVVPTIGGQAWITGYSTHVLDPTDPFVNGFTVGDLWA